MKKILLAGLLLFSIVFAQNDVLTVCTFPMPPYTFRDNTGNLKGLEIDLVNALFKEAGFRAEFKEYPWNRALAMLKEGELDMLMTLSMTPEMVIRIGKAIAAYFGKNNQNNHASIIIGKDTRISGDMLEHAVAAGISSMGMNVYLAGVIPTPGIDLARKHHAAAGVVISASHNPFYDNGIKLFKGDGFKLSDAEESEIENIAFDDTPAPSGQNIGRIYLLENSAGGYGKK